MMLSVTDQLSSLLQQAEYVPSSLCPSVGHVHHILLICYWLGPLCLMVRSAKATHTKLSHHECPAGMSPHLFTLCTIHLSF